MSSKIADTIGRYAIATVGLFLVAFGIAMSIVCNLGTAPLSCAAYVLNLRFTSVSVGTFIFIVNMAYMLVQLILLRRNFKLVSLMQVVASMLFGYMVDASLWMLSFMIDDPSLLLRFILLFVAGAITAVGVSIEVHSKAWMLSAEMTVAAFSSVLGKPFDRVKIVMDSSMVLIAALLSWLFFGNPFGSGELTSVGDMLLARSPGVVIGLGTLVLAVLPGYLMRFTTPALGRFF